MLVVFRMFLLAATTTMTERLPMKPSSAMRPKIIGMMMRTKYSKTTLVLEAASEQFDDAVMLANDTQSTTPESDSITPRHAGARRTMTRSRDETS